MKKFRTLVVAAGMAFLLMVVFAHPPLAEAAGPQGGASTKQAGAGSGPITLPPEVIVALMSIRWAL